MKKTNIFFVSLVMIAALAGNGFCAKVQDNIKELKTSVLAFAQEDIKALQDVLIEKHNVQFDPAFERLTLKVEKLKQAFPKSAGNISAVFEEIKHILITANSSGEKYLIAEGFFRNFEDLSTALVNLRNQDFIAFNATVGVLDVKYNSRLGFLSIDGYYGWAWNYWPQGSLDVEVTNKDGLVLAMEANPLKDVLNRLTKLQETEKVSDNIKNTLSYIVSLYSANNFGSRDWSYSIESAFESLESDLSKLKQSNENLYKKVVSIINREYNTAKGSVSIAQMFERSNQEVGCYVFADTGLIQDPQGILKSMDAYALQYR